MNKNTDSKLIKIPEHLKNAPKEMLEAYNKYLEVQRSLHENPKRWYTVPHPEHPEETIDVDLIQAVPNVRKKLKHIPKDEVDTIMLIWGDLQRIKAEMGRLKKIWNPPKYGKRGSISGLEPYAAEIIDMFGQWKTNEEVKKIIYDKWGYNVQLANISRFKTSNKDKIDALRTEWERSYEDFDIARKRGRIERLAFLAKTQMDKYKHRNEHSVVHSREIRSILEQIRKEVEGDTIYHKIDGTIDINTTINMNMSVQRLTQKVAINSFVVGLVAAKRNISAPRLMNKLIRSFYASHNGFMSKLDMNKEPEYPSNLIQTYDWNEIESKHAKGKVIDYEAEEPIDAEIVEDSVPEGSIKNKMLEILNKKQSELDKLSGK